MRVGRSQSYAEGFTEFIREKRSSSFDDKIFLLVVFLSSFILQPSSLIAQLISPYPHLTITSFNDNWGGGFTETKDDLRSFGFAADYQAHLYGKRVTQITATWSGLTNKFAPTPSRLDELKLDVRLPIFSIDPVWQIDGIVGGHIYGNLGGEAFQNRAHETTGVPLLELPYNESYRDFFKVGLSILGDMEFSEISPTSSLRFILGGRAETGFGYYGMLDLFGALAMRNTMGDHIQIRFGGRGQSAEQNPVLNAALDAESGFYVNYEMRLGLFNYGLSVYPGRNFSTGYLGISLFNWNERTTLEKVDALAEFGALSDANGFYIRYLWNNWTNNAEHFQFDFHYQFWTLANAKLPAYPLRYGHYQQFSLGGHYSFIAPKPTWQILPYLSARVGYKDERTYAGELPGPDYNVWSLNAIGEVGLRIKLPANIIHKNCYYGLTANYQYVLTLYKSNDLQLVSAYPFAQNLGYFGLGGFVMIDF